MASYMSEAGLNIAANAITSATVTLRPHTGAPGNSGTSNQVGSVTVAVPASGWTPAAAGVSQTRARLPLGCSRHLVSVLATTRCGKVPHSWAGRPGSSDHGGRR